MTVDENNKLNNQSQEAEPHDQQQRRLFRFSWWWVWMPIIIVVILWIGGWTFGNYGGPWTSKPRSAQPKISDPVVAVHHASRLPHS